MLDFRQASQSQPKWTQRRQMGWLLVVVVLGLILGMTRSGWQLLHRLQSSDTHQGQQRMPCESAVDTRVSPRSLEHEIPGTFVSPAGPETQPEPNNSGHYFRGVMSNYLQTVRDDSPFVHAEQDAWFNLLDVLNKADLDDLKRASRGPTTFVQLYRQSDEYRGELVTLRGIVRRVYRVAAPKNDYGLKYYYQIWLTPDDNLSNVEVVFCLRLPPGFPMGEGLSEHVEVAGFHFKRWLYRAQDTLRSAPVVLAQTIELQRRPVFGRRSDEGLGGVLTILVGTALAAMLFAVFLYFRTRRVRRRRPSEAKIEVPAPSEPRI